MTILDVVSGGTFVGTSSLRLTRGLSEGRSRLDWWEHLTVHGALPATVLHGTVDVLNWADAVDLRGRGGAHFPFARKARAVRSSRGAAVVVGNGSEGEPASHKDTVLMQACPHLVLDGLHLAARAVGARTVRLVVSDPAAGDSIRSAIKERRRAHVKEPRVTLRAAPGKFVAGESSAVVRIAGRGPARPAFTTRPAAAGGVDGQPTLVSNVETLAQLAVLARLGPARYAEVGLSGEPGTALLTLHRGGESRVVEAPIGISLRELFGGESWRAVLTGGYHGSWLDASTAADAVLSRDSLAAVGGFLGAGVLLALPVDACPLVESAPMVERMAAETIGQCGPCVNGLPAIASVLSTLAAGLAGYSDVARLQRWCGMVDGRGACAHPNGVARFVSSLLSVFESEVDLHLGGGCGLPYQGLLPLGELAA